MSPLPSSRSTDCDLVHRASLCPGGGQSHLHLPGSCQPSYHGIQVRGRLREQLCYRFFFIPVRITSCLFTPGGPRGAWCSRAPGRACSPPKPTTPSSPSPSPVWFSTPWERPTSASWWTFTVSHKTVISPRFVTRGPTSLHPSLESEG